MQNKLALFVIFFSWTLLANANSANHEVIQSWLEKMAHAGHMLNFSGTFVYGKNTDLSVMKIFHRADKFGELERLVSMDGSGREVIRNNNLVTCVLPDKNSVIVEKSRKLSKFPPSFPTQISKLNHYTFKLEQQENVAGHLAQIIAVNPKDKYRFGYKLWIDIKTGLLLKSNLINEKDEMVEQFLFTNLKYHEKLDDQLFKATTEGKKYTWYQADEQNDEDPKTFSDWDFDKLPPGFTVNIKRNHVMPRGKALKHLVVSDGLATVSVYVENHIEAESNLIDGTSMGGINAYGKHINEFHVTVVGEVPMITVKLICEATKRNF